MRSVPLGFGSLARRDDERAPTGSTLQQRRSGAIAAERLAFYHELARSAKDIAGVEQVGIGLLSPSAAVRYRSGIRPGRAIAASGGKRHCARRLPRIAAHSVALGAVLHGRR